jgi:S1-C subfamily serine protease
MHHRAEHVPNQPGQAAAMRPWTGLWVQAINSDLARQYHIGDMTGVFVGAVEAGSPAERAGLKVGDVIRTIDGRRIWTMEQARFRESEIEVGENLHITIDRHGQLLSVHLPVETEVNHGSPRPEEVPGKRAL